MRSLRAWWPLPVALVVVWAVVGYFLTKPPDFHDYRKAAVQAAESGYNAVSLAQLSVREQLADKASGQYVDSTLRRSADTVAGAWKQFAAAQPVDDATKQMGAQLGPILLSAVTVLGDLRAAEDDGAAATAQAVSALGPVADQLSDFLDRYR